MDSKKETAELEVIHRSLGLSDSQYRRIVKALGRRPSKTELAMFSVAWSEHCGYSSSRRWLKLLPKTGKYKTLIGEDSGGIILDDLALIFKIESHNHPSQIEPKQGAATGVGGIIRDIFTAGARPVALLNSLRFGPLNQAHNKYLFAGVVEGIQFYGNCVGVPTVGGEIYFDKSYTHNCLVNVMCLGVAKRDKLFRAQASGQGNAVMYVGASTGRDGIGGCSVLASDEFKENQVMRPAVQIGDPFTEKRLIEATLEAIDTGFIVGIKDMGAAGLSCSITEMASAGASGMDLDLQAVPRREENMQPWEVMLSESQERMLVCVKQGKEEAVKKVFLRWDLNAAVLGRVTAGRLVTIRDKKKIVAEINPCLLADAPVYSRRCRRPEHIRQSKQIASYKTVQPKDYNKALLKLLADPSIASKAWVYSQYDHMVGTNTVVLPGSDAAVIRLRGRKKAIAATTDCNSKYCFFNPYRGAQIAVAEAARNLVCAGADPAAVTDCLNFGNPEKAESFWQFKNCVKGIGDACRAFNLAVVSGNVSFYNESPYSAIKPTPVIGMIGIIDNIEKVCRQNFKQEGDIIILLGDCKNELGASSYLKVVHGLAKGRVPQLDLKIEKAVQKTALEAIQKGFVHSAHDCSEGGLAVALAESCVTDENSMIGAVVDSLYSRIRKDALLFGESQSRVILSCSQESAQAIKRIAQINKAPYRAIGRTGGRRLKVLNGSKELIDLSLNSLRKEWGRSLKKSLVKEGRL